MPNIAVSVNTDDAKDVSAVVVFLSKFLSDTVTPIAALVKAEVKPEPEPQASMVFRQNDKPVTITPPPPAPPAHTGPVDKDGIPWDVRIHSDSKAKTDSGFWRRRRNLTDDYYDSVVAELKGGAPAPAPVVTPPPVTPPPAPVAESSAAIPPGPTSEPITFASLTTRLGAAVTAGKLTHEQVMQILGNHGVVGLKGLLTAQGVYASVSAELDALLALS